MKLDLAERVALVTGASRGIGQAISIQLARLHARVLALDLPGEPVAETIDLVEAEGGSASAIEGDVSCADDWQRALETVKTEHGRLDILVNNAGIGGPLLPLVDYPDEDFDKVMTINAGGTFLGIKYGARLMREQGGSIVNVASVSGGQALQTLF